MSHIKCWMKRLKPIPFAIITLIGANVAAQTDPAAAPPADASSQPAPAVGFETVIVKAQRRAEKLQDVPVVVNAFTAKQIEDAGIKSTQDFLNLVPNVAFDNSFTYGNSFVVIRGVTQINNADSPVAVVVDGVPQSNQKQLKMNLFDIQSIEVLKGPQGALYGRNAIGGAINIETKQPRNRFEGFAGLELGNGGAVGVSAGVGGALVDDVVMMRVVGQSKKTDGLILNTYTGTKADPVDHDNSMRAMVTVRASDAVKLDFRAGVTDIKAGATWSSIVNPPGVTPSAKNYVLPASSLLGKTFGSTDDYSVKAEIETGLGVVTSISAYSKLKESYRGDLDFSNPVNLPNGFGGNGYQAGQGQDLDVELLSQELRITSPSAQSFRWIAGGYYLGTKRALATKAFRDLNGQLGQYDDPSKNLIARMETNDNASYAGFGQIDYDVREGTVLSLALRHDKDDRDQLNVVTGLRRQQSFGMWQPKATISTKLDPSTLTYFTYSTGFRSGGFNAPGLPNFRAESLRNYEIGAKTTLLGKRLVLNAAVFYSESRDFQIFYYDASKAAQIITNLERVTIKGLDLDFRYLAMRGLQFDGGIGYTDSRIKENASDPTTVGNRTPKATPLKATLGIQYGRPLSAGLNGNIRLDLEHRSKRYWHADNVAVSDPVDLVNLRVAVSEVKDKWTASLFARNLTDAKYYADYNASKYSGNRYGAGLPYDTGSVAPPREFGFDVKYRF